MGSYADLANKLFDVLENERTSGSLTYLKKVYFGEQDKIVSLSHPWVWVRLDDQDPVVESWVAVKDRRDGDLTMLADVEVDVPDPARPYGVTGDAAKRGILTVAEDVMNRIDARRADFVAPTIPACFDLNLSLRQPRNVGDKVWAASVAVRFRTRFNAGGR